MPIEAPEIAVLVPRTDHWADLARHLLTPLGLPQVAVVEEGAAVASSVHSVVALGPERWAPSPAVPVWMLTTGAEPTAEGNATFALETGELVELPTEQTLTVVADGRDALGTAAAGVEQTLFWLRERLNKGAGPLSLREYREWLLALRLMDVAPGREDGIYEALTLDLDRRAPVALHAPDAAADAPLEVKGALADPARLIEVILDAGRNGAVIRDIQEYKTLAHELLTRANTGHRLVAIGLCAILLQEENLIKAVQAQLAGAEWRTDRVAFPHAVPAERRFAYSPLVAAWRFLEARREDRLFSLPEGAGGVRKHSMHLPWRRLPNGQLVDPISLRISRSLIDNWLVLHTAPCPVGTQYKLTWRAYRSTIQSLELIWFDIFKAIQNNLRRPRLRPWPAGCTSAVSLRYDVDRAVTTERIEAIAATQRRHAGAPFASWYYFADDRCLMSQSRELNRLGQEIGVHVETADVAKPGLGVTHHSAPTSDYWRGDATNAALERAGAAYCEFLAAQIPTPRPAWIVAPNGSGHLSAMWTTPIYFPLEGSTSDSGLEYFDRLVDEFRRTISNGGHAIVGSHPDLDQVPFIELLSREDFSRTWFAPIGQVIDRCRRVLGYGEVVTVGDARDGEIALKSRFQLAGVVVEIWRPDAAGPQTRTIEFPRSRPVVLDIGAAD